MMGVVRGLLAMAVLCALLSGCGVDEGELAENVKQSMQQEFQTNRDLPFLTVENVELIHADGNQYEGMATLATSEGVRRQVPVHVTAEDGDRGLWRLDQGALMWARRS